MNNFLLPIRFEAILYVKKGDDYKFLLIKRIPEDGDFWQPVTGTQESKESLIDCLYRELEEEINIRKTEVRHLTDMFYSFTWEKGPVVITEYVFGVELTEERPIVLSKEHNDQRWCSFEEAVGLLGKDNNIKALKEFNSRFIV